MPRHRHPWAILLLPLLIMGTVRVWANGDLSLLRSVSETSLSPGEIGQVTLELTNDGGKAVEYTLIEEIPPELSVIETGGGSYNKTAGFIVWRGSLEAHQRQTLGYTFRMQEGPSDSVPLYGYLSATDGSSVESAGTLNRVALAFELRLQPTLVARGEDATLHLSLMNPFPRPLHVNLDVAQPATMALSLPIPASVQLAAGERWEHTTRVRVAEVGNSSLSIQPSADGVPVGQPYRVTLRVKEAKEALEVLATVAPVLTRRTHTLRLAKDLLTAEEDLLLITPIPTGASYVPGTARVAGQQPIEPQVRRGHLLFTLPFAEQVELSYVLQYADGELITAGATSNSDTDVGLVALGAVPRLLRGSENLFELLQGEVEREPRPRRDVVILSPHPNQVFVERGQVDIAIDAPQGSTVTLLVNNQEIPQSRVGSIEVDEGLGRHTLRYIAVPLGTGANSLLARALTPEGDQLTDGIMVHRSGPPATLAIDPVTDFRTGSVRPLMVQISAADTSGLPPPDGTAVTVTVEGGEILSEDAHPDWLGHQLPLYAGRGFLQIESPTQPTVVTVRARIGEVSSEKRFTVRNQADSWLVVGNGQLTAETALRSSPPISISTEAHAFVRGPLGPHTVFTAAFDSTGLSPSTGEPVLWTGDTSSTGSFTSGSGTVSARLDRGLSYLQYGRGLVEFEGELSKYGKQHDGLQMVVDGGPKLKIGAFYTQESLDTIEEVFDGDGTGYYRLTGRFLEQRSEELAIITRSARFPHEVLGIARLERGRYFIDYHTGQLILAEPLASTDGEGNRLSLRVRYRLAGEQRKQDLGGLQITAMAGPVQLRATTLQDAEAFGATPRLMAVGAEAHLGKVSVDLEVARSRSKGLASDGYVLTLKYPDLGGWTLDLSHRDIASGFLPTEANVSSGIRTTLSGQRRFRPSLQLTTSASVARKDHEAPWVGESTVDASWRAGIARPELMLRAHGGETLPLSLGLDVGVGLDLASGTLSYKHQQALVGTEPTKDAIKASYPLTRNQDIQLAFDTETNSTGTSKKLFAWGLTQRLEGSAGGTAVTGGYEFTESAHTSEGALVLGTRSAWPLNDSHTVELNLDHKRPLVSTAPLGFGAALGWTYHRPEGESEFRLDRRTGEGGLKQSFQWRGYHAIGEDFAYRGDALWTVDSPSKTRHRLSFGTAYRTRGAVIFADITADHLDEAGHREWDIDWRVKSAQNLGPKLQVQMGYANRKTLAPTTTDKAALGIRYGVAPRTELLLEGTLLRQRDTQTQHSGIMAGASRQIHEDLWLTLGWRSSDYTGFESAGPDFAKRRASFFVRFDLAFDEWSLQRWLSPHKRD